MKTKTVTLNKVSASFSTSAQHIIKVTLPREPWAEDDDAKATPQDQYNLARRTRIAGGM